MRIVAGTLRGRTIEAPSGEGTRPTTDRVREALFSSLYSLRGGFEGAVVLDAFAGSGALGIEAISRGAHSAVFYERDAKAAAVLKRNFATCKLDSPQARIVQNDVLERPPSGAGPAFDLVFLDPPYDYEAKSVFSMASAMAESGSLADEAIIVYEHSQKSAAAVEAAAKDAGFDVFRYKKYGKTGVTILTSPMGK